MKRRKSQLFLQIIQLVQPESQIRQQIQQQQKKHPGSEEGNYSIKLVSMVMDENNVLVRKASVNGAPYSHITIATHDKKREKTVDSLLNTGA